MKGSVLDVLVIPIIAFVLLIAVIFTYSFLSDFNAVAQDILPQQARNFTQESLNQFIIFDQAIIIMIAGLFVAALIGAAMINSHPVFFVGSVMFLIVAIFVGAVINNILVDIVTNQSISASANMFPYTLTFFQNLPMWLVVFTLSISIAMFTVGRRSGDVIY